MKIYQRGWVWFLAILALISFNQFIFIYFFKISYFNWYLQNGSLIGAFAVLVTLAWDINKNTGLISADPRYYIAAHSWLIGTQISSLGTFGKSTDRKPIQGASALIVLLDSLTALLIGLLIILLFILWFILIVPIQYFLILILGGLGRMYQSAPVRLITKFTNNHLETMEIPREEKYPDEWMDVGAASKPVSFTYSLIILVLAVINYFI